MGNRGTELNKTDCAPQQDVSLTDEGKTAALPVAPRWYCVSRDGMATLCTCEADAKVEAANARESYPRNGPYRAVRLAAVDEAEERSAGYWRRRCLEHAVEIDSLRTTLGLALVALEYHRDQTRPTELSDEAISALRLVVGPNARLTGLRREDE